MKPLLILAPSPSRWSAFSQLLKDEDPRRLEDLRLRVCEGVRGARDAFVVLPESSRILACACLRRKHDIGVMDQVYVAPDHRQQGRGRSMMQALLSWFDMSGGKWLYLTCTREVGEYVFEKFGFLPLHEHEGRTAMRRTVGRPGDNPFEKMGESLKIRELSRGDWPLMTALLQHYAGADPRVPLNESALEAEAAVLDLLTQQDAGACKLLGAWRNKRLVGFGSVALADNNGRTYAMLAPHDQPPEGLREALLNFAQERGFNQVDFPMEALAQS